MTAKSGRRDRRQDLLVAASRLFVAQGYHASTMDDIANALRLNKGTLYYYYESKANILFDIMLKINQRYLEAVRIRRPDTPPRDAVREYIETTVIFILNNLDDTRLNQQEWPFIDMWLTKDQARLLRDCFKQIEATLMDRIKEAEAAGEFRAIDSRLAVEAIIGMASWLPRWFNPRGRFTIEEIARQFGSLIIDGLVAQPGVALSADSESVPVRRGTRTPRKLSSV